jgi:hypothetical protein
MPGQFKIMQGERFPSALTLMQDWHPDAKFLDEVRRFIFFRLIWLTIASGRIDDVHSGRHGKACCLTGDKS